jgi:hypothetical protein
MRSRKLGDRRQSIRSDCATRFNGCRSEGAVTMAPFVCRVRIQKSLSGKNMRTESIGLRAARPDRAVVFSAFGNPVSGPLAQIERGSFLFPFGALCDIPPCIQHRPPAPLNFLDSVVRTSSGLEFGWAGKPETDTFGHELALVARTCSPAKLLGFLKFVGAPRCNDARRCHPCSWHNQGAPAAMAFGGEASGAVQEGNPLGPIWLI